MLYENVLEAVGNTPLVRLNRVAAGVRPVVAAKLEFVNPGSSVKDRIGLEMVEAAEREGLLRPGGTIVEGTSGNTGMGLAMVAAVKGYHCIVTMPDKMSREKMDALRALGAEVIVCPTAVDHDDPRSYHQVALRLSREIPGAYFPNQYDHPANPQAHYNTTAPEIWEQSGGRVTHVVIGVGTGGTATGVGRWFREHHPHVRVIGVDPEGSIFYEAYRTGAEPEPFPYKVEGIGQESMPANVDFSVLHDMVQVSDKDSFNMARRLSRSEGLFVGGSSGSAVVAALRVAEGCGPDDLIVVLLPDSGSRYLSKIYDDNWMRENQYFEPPVELSAHEVLGERLDGQNGLVAVGTEATLGQAVDRMRAHGISQLPVLAEDGTCVGRLDENNLLQALLGDADAWHHNVQEFMGAPFLEIAADASLSRIAEALRECGEAVLVREADGALAMLTKSDLIYSLARAERGEAGAA